MSATRHAGIVLAAACVLGAALVLAPVPAGVRLVLVLPVALLAPGLCVTRLARLREPLIEAAVAFPLSAALWVALAQAQLYLHLWAPRAGIVALLLACAASVAVGLPRPVTARAPARGPRNARRPRTARRPR